MWYTDSSPNHIPSFVSTFQMLSIGSLSQYVCELSLEDLEKVQSHEAGYQETVN